MIVETGWFDLNSMPWGGEDDELCQLLLQPTPQPPPALMNSGSNTSNHDCYEELAFQLQHRLALNPRPWQAASSNHQPNDQQIHRCSASLSTLLPNSSKSVANERERREKLNGQYLKLRNLVPNPTGKDRLTTVEDAIEYIKELVRAVNELRSKVAKRRKKNATGDADKQQDINVNPLVLEPAENSCNSGSFIRNHT